MSYRLYRQHTWNTGEVSVKDLELLGRDMSSILIIDNMPENFSKQPENGIVIKSWCGEPGDQALGQ